MDVGFSFNASLEVHGGEDLAPAFGGGKVKGGNSTVVDGGVG